MVNLIEQLLSIYIISGNFNFHNIIWGSKNTTRDKLSEKLNILNNGMPTRFNISTRDSSCIAPGLYYPNQAFYPRKENSPVYI